MSTPQPTIFSGIFQRFALLDGERALLLQITGSQPLQQVETDNEQKYADLLGTLLADSGPRHVVEALNRQHNLYDQSLQPRIQTIQKRVRDVRLAIQRSVEKLSNLGPIVNTQLQNQKSQLIESEKILRNVGNGVSSHLKSILRRSKLERLVLDSLHALFILAFFTLGFGWVGDSVCEWVARVSNGPPPSQEVCLALWALVTIVLFSVERWFLGPVADRWVESRIKKSTEKLLGFYFVERTRLEYRLKILEYETDQMMQELKKYGVI